jgi:hypothetical protein
MSRELQQLLEAAKIHQFTPADREEHRRSFAYGNTKIENSRITREMIDREADNLKSHAHVEIKARV